ncbi:MAG: hypothetical protein DRI86_13905 [Bacteroidetes bacterium]|nr:MAG: hypothetical protein DRI86_13905 [Bacteroidota bacterium]
MPTIEQREQLDRLIESALADGKLSKKEIEVLTKKAKSIGIDEDEFLIELDAEKINLKKTKKDNKVGFFNKVIYHRKAGVKMEEVEKGLKEEFLGGGKTEYQEVPVNELIVRLWHVLVPLLFVIIGSGIGYNFYINHTTIDKALANYDFEKARELMGELRCEGSKGLGLIDVDCPRTIQEVKIIQQESHFLIENDQFEKAIHIVKSVEALPYYQELYDNGKITIYYDDLLEGIYIEIMAKISNNTSEYRFEQLQTIYSGIQSNQLRKQLYLSYADSWKKAYPEYFNKLTNNK